MATQKDATAVAGTVGRKGTAVRKESLAGEKKRRMTRLNLAYPEETRERLHRLKEEAGLTTITEVIANAIRAYEFILDQRKRGRELLVRGEGEPLTLVKLFF